MGEPKKTGDDLDMRIERDALRHNVLGPAIKQNHDESNEQIKMRAEFLVIRESWPAHLNCEVLALENILNCLRFQILFSIFFIFIYPASGSPMYSDAALSRTAPRNAAPGRSPAVVIPMSAKCSHEALKTLEEAGPCCSSR